jgi:hypothetical protein
VPFLSHRLGFLDTARRWFVDERPKHADFLDSLNKIQEANRLDDLGVDSKFVALAQIAIFARRCQNHNRDETQLVGGLELS